MHIIAPAGDIRHRTGFLMRENATVLKINIWTLKLDVNGSAATSYKFVA
jgi:hypothetical protein